MRIRNFIYLFVLLFISFNCLTGARKTKNKFLKRRSSGDLAPSSRFLFRLKRAASRSCDVMKSCRCRSKRSLVCTKPDCLRKLPARSISKRRGEHIETILVTRQHNFSHVMSDDFVDLPNLRSIRFFNNGIMKVDGDAFQFTKLVQRLDLHLNKLREVPTAIRDLPDLKRLNLGGNLITSIPTNAFDYNPMLEFLVLRRNDLVSFPAMLPRGLVKLSVGSNRIKDVPDIRYLKRLKVLRLESNQLSYFNSAAIPKSVEVLSLCHNKLSSTQRFSFDKFRKLRRLRMAGNPDITEINQHLFFRTATPLLELDLRDCAISHIDANAFSCIPRLRAINLRGNQLQTYNKNWFVQNNKINKLTLSDNPWHCNCAFKHQLSDFERAAKNKVVRRNVSIRSRNRRMIQFYSDFHNITCAGPPQKDSSLRPNLNKLDTSKCGRSAERWHFKPSTCTMHGNPPSWVLLSSTSRIITTTSKTSRTTTTTSGSKILLTETTTPTSVTTSKVPPITSTTKAPFTSTARVTTTTTRRAPTSTTTTRKPTTTTTTTTTRKKPTTTAITRVQTSTTTTQKLPTTTTTTTRKNPTTPTTTFETSTTTTTTTATTTAALTKESKRVCTPGGDCVFPFTYDGVDYDGNCVYGWRGYWCYLDSKQENNYDYCQPCEGPGKPLVQGDLLRNGGLGKLLITTG